LASSAAGLAAEPARTPSARAALPAMLHGEAPSNIASAARSADRCSSFVRQRSLHRYRCCASKVRVPALRRQNASTEPAGTIRPGSSCASTASSPSYNVSA
jgi:hypothetical protein